MASWGIGLGGLADGLEQGYGLGRKMVADARESKKASDYDNAMIAGKKDFDESVAKGETDANDIPASLRFATPHIMKAAIQNRDVDKLKFWTEWKDTDEAKTGAKLFESGMRRLTVGDMQGGWSDFTKLGKLKGYGGDYEIGELQPTQNGGFQTTIKMADGRSNVKTFANGEEVVRFAAKVGNPAVAFEDLRNTQKRQEANADDATRYGARAGIDTQAQKDRAPIEISTDEQKTRNRSKIAVQQKKDELPINVDQRRQYGKVDTEHATDMIPVQEELNRRNEKIRTDAEVERTPNFLDRHAGVKDIDTTSELTRQQLGLGPSQYDLTVGTRRGEDGKPVNVPMGYNRRTNTAEPIKGLNEGDTLDKPHGGSGHGRGTKPYSWEVMRDAFKAAGYSDNEALERATGKKPATEIEMQRAASAILNAKMPKPAFMSEKQKTERDTAYKGILDDLRTSMKSTQGSGAPSSTPTPAPGINRPQPGASTAPAVRAAEKPAQMTPGNGNKPVDVAMPVRPSNVPKGSAYSPSRRQWRTPDGQVLDMEGNPVQ